MNQALTANELADALKKLISFSYFDNSYLHYRDHIASFLDKHDTESKVESFLESLQNEFEESFEALIKSCRGELMFYPKKVSQGNPPKASKSFYSNDNMIGNCHWNSLSIFYELPLKIHVLIVAWIIREGFLLDKAVVSNDNYGNRLSFLEDRVNPGRTLIKPYQNEYQKWWDRAIKTTKDALKDNDDVTLINFDLKDFYHSVELDFDKLEKYFIEKHSSIHNEVNQKLLKLLKCVLQAFKDELLAIQCPSVRTETKLYPLPIGVMSSTILANWYLSDFDAVLKEVVNPRYYGRYVDDILIVINDRLLNEDDKQSQDLPEIVFIERNFSEILVVANSGDENNLSVSINSETKGLADYRNIQLQLAKFFIYQFNHNLSPNLINKFAEDQKNRSSIFNYLSDSADDFFKDFDDNVFESAFDGTDVNKAKFKNLEDNKFRLSVFLSKLINRRIFNEGKYREGEIEKIQKYFKGFYLVKHFYFWEKLFTIFVVYNRKKEFVNLLVEISFEISKLKRSNEFSMQISESQVRATLRRHLFNSIRMALGLNPSFIIGNQESLIFNSENQKNTFISLINDTNSDYSNKSILSSLKLFRRSGLLRKQHVPFPLTQFIDWVRDGDFSILDSSFFTKVDLALFKEDGYSQIINKWFVPYRVKFYECSLLLHLLYIHTRRANTKDKPFYVSIDFANSNYFLEASFEMYAKLNFIDHFGESYKTIVKNQIFGTQPDPFINYTFINKERPLKCFEIFVPNKLPDDLKKADCTIGVVNINITMEYILGALKGSPVLNERRAQVYLGVLDQIRDVRNLSIFVLPELSLPVSYLPLFTRKCAELNKALIAGIEHINVERTVYNFIFTALPVNIDGDRDAIPVFRLKNHYAPLEEYEIRERDFFVPKPAEYHYNLFQWNNIYFTCFYCFEIADITHRVWPMGLVDSIFMPVWNRDVNYYSNVIEAASRDLHCMIVQSNTNIFGDSRITVPASTVTKDLAKTKGGISDDYPFSLLVHKFDFNRLREFQTWGYGKQGSEKKEEEHSSYKPTPPDFRKDLAEARLMGKRLSQFLK